MMNLTAACWVIKMVNARNIGVSNQQVSAYAAEPGLYGVSRSKRLMRSLLMPTSLLGLAYTNDCAQHSHPSAAIRAIFTASMHLCHSPTFKNRKPWHTPGNVKLLLPPRQSRGISHLV